MTELQTDLNLESETATMTTATATILHPIFVKLITLIVESDDDGTINGFLELFDVEAVNIPIEHLVTDLVLLVDEDGGNWLACNEFTDSITTLVNLIAKDPTRIPAVDVHTALRTALACLACDDQGSAIAFLTDVALLIPATIAPFPLDILASMITYGEREDIWEVRLAVVMTLSQLGRGAECAMYIDDEDYDVASEAIGALPHTPETRGLLEELLTDEDLHADVIAAAQRVINEIDGETQV